MNHTEYTDLLNNFINDIESALIEDNKNNKALYTKMSFVKIFWKYRFPLKKALEELNLDEENLKIDELKYKGKYISDPKKTIYLYPYVLPYNSVQYYDSNVKLEIINEKCQFCGTSCLLSNKEINGNYAFCPNCEKNFKLRY